MTHIERSDPAPFPRVTDKVITLALSLARAEQAIHDFSHGQVDAIVDPDGRAYLLRNAQEHLRQDEQRLRAILDSMSDGLTVVRRSGRIVSQNRTGSRMLGYQRDELIGANLFELIDPADMLQLHSAFFNVIEEFLPEATVEFHLRMRDGSYCWVEAAVSRLRDPAAACVVLTCREMTRRAPTPETKTHREAALIEASLEKDRFLAMLSHELRTPLAPALLGVAELQGDNPTPEAKTTLRMIRRNLELQAHLLEELLDFTTLGQHKVRLRLEPIDAHDAIDFVLEICRGEIAAARIAVSLDLHAAQSVVLADSVRLQQVMWNLVRNAVKFSAPGSRIAIATANETAGWLTIKFADHGIGIEAALLPRIFDSFQQGDLSNAQRREGLGLGLYIARGMAEAQGGTLTVLSEGPGRGAMFRLTLATAPSSNSTSTLPTL
jgi:two-component system CheB/CheR fusion protein